MTLPQDLTSTERILYRAEFGFATGTLGLSQEEAHAKALDKIRRTRELRDTLTFRY